MIVRFLLSVIILFGLFISPASADFPVTKISFLVFAEKGMDHALARDYGKRLSAEIGIVPVEFSVIEKLHQDSDGQQIQVEAPLFDYMVNLVISEDLLSININDLHGINVLQDSIDTDSPSNEIIYNFLKRSIVRLQGNKQDSVDLGHPSEQVPQPETLRHVYQGISSYFRGDLFAALESFSQLYENDASFPRTRAWLLRTYRAVSLEDLADTLENIFDSADYYLPINEPKKLDYKSGLVFLGIETDFEDVDGVRFQLGARLVDSLQRQSYGPLIVSDDIEDLKEEFDLLVGIEKASGISWQRAPDFFYQHTVYALLRKNQKRYILEVFFIENLSPEATKKVSIPLSKELETWEQDLDVGVTQLKPSALEYAQTLKSPDVLSKQLSAQYNNASYLELLVQEPWHPEYLGFFPILRGQLSELEFCLRFALHRTLISRIEASHEVRPWVWLAYATFTIPDRFRDEIRCLNARGYIEELTNLSTEYPKHPAGLIAQFNLLLHSLKREEYSKALAEIERLTIALEEKIDTYPNPERMILPALAHIDYWRETLELALGDGETSHQAFETVRKGYIQAYYCDRAEKYPCIKTNPLFLHADSLEAPIKNLKTEMGIALELTPIILRQETTADTVLDILSRNSGSHVALEYAYSFLSNLSQRYENIVSLEKLSELYQVYGAVLMHALSLESVPYDIGTIASLLEPLLEPDTSFRASLWQDYDFIKLRNSLLSKAIEAVLEQRFGYRTNDNLSDLLSSAAGLEYEDLLIQRADRAWKENPIEDRGWLSYADWKHENSSNSELGILYKARIKQLREKFPRGDESSEVMRLYYRFAVVLFQAELYEEAQGLFEAIELWKPGVWKSIGPDSDISLAELKVNALYLRSHQALRDGNLSQALSLAKKAFERADAKQYRLRNYRLETCPYHMLDSILVQFISRIRQGQGAENLDPYSYLGCVLP